MNPIYGETLYHYGIKGQKWGVKRYQNADRTWTDEGKIRYGRKGTLAKKRAEKKDKSKDNNKKVGTAFVPLVDPSQSIGIIRSRSKNADPHQKKGNHGELLMRGVEAGAIAANVLGSLTPASIAQTSLLAGDLAIRAGKAIKSHYNTKKYNAERESNPIDKKTGFHKKTIKMDEAEDLKRVNPEINNFNSNTKSNCMLCTTAYELRRRGYDVRAEKAGIGYDDNDINRWFPDAKLKSIDMGKENQLGKTISATVGLNNNYAKEVIKSIEKDQPNGARGNLIVRWGGGGAHSMVYEIKNNKLVILDSQLNKIYTNPEKVLRSCINVQYARLDNLRFNTKSIKECCS